MDKAKEFESLLRGWFLGNVDDDRLLDFVLNYGLSSNFKKIEVKTRDKLGRE